jgi:sulfite exporter TauE/SafE
MQWPLVLAGLLTGIAASPHCATMCGAPCAALTGGCRRSASGFHLGRLLGYMAGGALAAGSVALLGLWSAHAPAIRPLWVLLHVAFLGLGLWWLVTGRQVSALKRSSVVPITFVDRRARPLRASLAGLAWVAWPCAALQTGLLLAALANTPQGGALVMGAFALGSMPALGLAPWAWARWTARRRAGASTDTIAAIGLRVAGAGLLLSSGWVLTRGMWPLLDAWCRSVA